MDYSFLRARIRVSGRDGRLSATGAREKQARLIKVPAHAGLMAHLSCIDGGSLRRFLQLRLPVLWFSAGHLGDWRLDDRACRPDSSAVEGYGRLRADDDCPAQPV